MKNFNILAVELSPNGEKNDSLKFAVGANPSDYRKLLDRIASTSQKKIGSEKKPSPKNPAGFPDNKTENKKCGICLEEFGRHSKVVTCNCGRCYHILCATQVGECPICDADLLALSSRLMDRGKVNDYSFIWGK